MPERHRQQRIVVGVDGSPRSVDALRWALRQAVLTGASLEPVSVWDWPAMALAQVPLPDLDLTEPTLQALGEAVAHAVADTPGGDGVHVRSHVRQGYAPHVLVECAQGADLLVVGSRGHSAVAEILLGSVGLHCATHAPCPVLIIRNETTHEDRQP